MEYNVGHDSLSIAVLKLKEIQKENKYFQEIKTWISNSYLIRQRYKSAYVNLTLPSFHGGPFKIIHSHFPLSKQ